jgi:hypothetical protein
MTRIYPKKEQITSTTGKSGSKRLSTRIHLKKLELLLLKKPKHGRGRADGIHFQGFRYMETTLAGYVGEEVTIRYAGKI